MARPRPGVPWQATATDPPHSLDVSGPVWEEDPDFALAHHVRRVALPEPGGEPQLREPIATELTERLDRDHPLWRSRSWNISPKTGGR